MKKIIMVFLMVWCLILPVSAMEFQPPVAPDSAEDIMPGDTESFGEGLWFITKQAISQFLPEIGETFGSCLSIFAVMILTSVLDNFSGMSGKTVHLAAVIVIGIIVLNPANDLTQMGVDTVTQLSDYNKLLLPVLSGALAAQGGVTSSTALYTVTTFISSVMTSLVKSIGIPLLYFYFCMALVSSAVHNELIKNLQNFMKWLITWSMKIVLYVFIGFVSVTGVVSGTADASAVKAVKLTLSGMIPVVGGIISDASETILISAGVMKSAAGIYGILAIIAIFIGPFLKIGCQYLMLKVTGALCSVFCAKQESDLLKDFSSGMGLLLAMTGTVCLILLIGVVCFMRGLSI